MALKGLVSIPIPFSPQAVLGVSASVLASVKVPDAQVVQYPEAYVLVASVETTKTQCTASAWSYDTDQKANLLKIATYQFDVNLVGANALNQAYTYMKTLPEFAGFWDVLEDGQSV